ncbi:hypothetical protein [Acinetobacter sp. ANC 3882]|uniref:hypothetical protein n=1 Tax=Acinetobacter sp. ANC 3882 TaxID=2923423 RepID=UPI001F4B4571|nr:hypothetical protein [Acinetobacter sp. ANC 3882]MCH7312896.1 hypothetical protein [Acinetobacter sp. ANC 3882]
MNPATFTIKDHSDITKTMSYLHTNYTQANFENKPLVVTIKSFDGDRSKAQNRLYWKWLSQWAKRQGTEKDYEHNFFKRTLLSRIYYRDDVGEYRKTYDAVRQLRAEQHPLYQQLADSVAMLTSTTDASIAQFTEYLNDIHAFCLKQGCYLETPDDLIYALEN